MAGGAGGDNDVGCRNGDASGSCLSRETAGRRPDLVVNEELRERTGEISENLAFMRSWDILAPSRRKSVIFSG